MKHRWITTALTAGAMALLAAAPAVAQEQECEDTCLQPPDAMTLLTGGTTVSRATLGPVFSVASTTVDSLSGKTLSQSASAEILEDRGDAQTIGIQCSASALPNAIATGITECYLYGKGKKRRVDAPTHGSLPGTTDATAEVIVDVEWDRWKVCVKSSSFFQDNTYIEAPAVCS